MSSKSGIRIFLIAGARPNFMKIAPIYDELAKREGIFEAVIVHTGQHYDDNMSRVFFDQLEMPWPDFYLGVGSGSHGTQMAELMRSIEKLFIEEEPHIVLVVGDVNSTLAAALVAKKMVLDTPGLGPLWQGYERILSTREVELQVPSRSLLRRRSHRSPLLIHVEAGERSFDMSMPEEINRLETDLISDLLFTTSVDSDQNLYAEGVDPRTVYRVGNIMIDSLQRFLPKARQSTVLTTIQQISKPGLSIEPGKYALATFHRPANVDDPANLQTILSALNRLSETVPVVFPMHPRTRKLIMTLGTKESKQLSDSQVVTIEPQGYLDFMKLQCDAAVVLTDSGGVQVETSYLGVPCLTLRVTTEWQVTLREGTNRLVTLDKQAIVERALAAIQERQPAPGSIPLWDGQAAQRIVRHILQILEVR